MEYRSKRSSKRETASEVHFLWQMYRKREKHLNWYLVSFKNETYGMCVLFSEYWTTAVVPKLWAMTRQGAAETSQGNWGILAKKNNTSCPLLSLSFIPVPETPKLFIAVIPPLHRMGLPKEIKTRRKLPYFTSDTGVQNQMRMDVQQNVEPFWAKGWPFGGLLWATEWMAHKVLLGTWKVLRLYFRRSLNEAEGWCF